MSFGGGGWSVNILRLEHNWVDIGMRFLGRKSTLNIVKLEIHGPKFA